MRTFVLTAATLVAAGVCLAQEPAQKYVETPGHADAIERRKDIYPRYSVVGEWRMTHPAWDGSLTLAADGTLRRGDRPPSGRWTLTADRGTPMLILQWNKYATEALTMVSPEYFRGNNWNGSFFELRRGEKAPAESSAQTK